VSVVQSRLITEIIVFRANGRTLRKGVIQHAARAKRDARENSVFEKIASCVHV
jgi:hypothetical protein